MKNSTPIDEMSKEEYQEFFANRLANLIRDKGIKQEWLSDNAEITNVQLSRYVQGKCIPSAYSFMKIAAAMGVSGDYMLGLSDIQATKISCDGCKYSETNDVIDVLKSNRPCGRCVRRERDYYEGHELY